MKRLAMTIDLHQVVKTFEEIFNKKKYNLRFMDRSVGFAPILEEKDQTHMRLVCSDKSALKSIISAISLGDPSNASIDSKSGLIEKVKIPTVWFGGTHGLVTTGYSTQIKVEKLQEMTPDQIKLLIRISQKYNDLGSSMFNKSLNIKKRAVLQAAAQYLMSDKSEAEYKKVSQAKMENSNWLLGKGDKDSTLTLLTEVEDVARAHQEKDKRVWLSNPKK